jgi:4-oxalocrotonate tautomerase
MPVITMDGGKLNKEQKAELAKTFTDNAARVTQIPAAAFVVIFRENSRENVATGGVLLADRDTGR